MADPTGLDLGSILKASGAFLSNIDTNTQALQAVSGKQEKLANQSADLMNIIGDSMAIVDTVKQTAELRTQESRIKAANAMGTNLKDTSEVITALSNDVATAYIEKRAARAAVDEKRSVSLMENPLEYLSNLLTINTDINRHNAADAKLESASRQIQLINQNTQTTIATQNALTEGITAQSIQASAEVLRAKANVDANNARIQGWIYNADGIKAAMSADKEKLGVVFQIFGAQKAEQQANIALANFALHREQFQFQKARYNEAKGDEQYEESRIISLVNTGIVNRLGAEAGIIKPGTPEAKHIVKLVLSNSPMGKQYQADYHSGEETAKTGIRSIGSSPAIAAEVMATQAVKIIPGQEPLVSIINQARQNVDYASKIPGSTLDRKDKRAVDAALNAEAKKLYDDKAARINFGDSDNPFNIPSIRSLISNSPTLTKLPVVVKVIQPAIVTGVDVSDPNRVFGLAAEALRTKQITYPEFLELSTVYQTGVATNIASRQFPSLGFAPKYSYNVQLTIRESQFNREKATVDMTKPDSLGRALNQYLASQAIRNLQQSDPSLFPGLGSNR